MEVTDVAEAYLSNLAYNSYMYSSNDLNSLTILDENVSESSLYRVAAEMTATEELTDVQKYFCTTLGNQLESRNDVVVKMKENIQFLKDKSAYFSEIRQYNGIARKDFDVEYVVTDAKIQGNIAILEVLENLSFQYIGTPEPSFCQEEHTVFLVKVDDEWYVANVETKYDWFSNEYKNSNYDIATIIANEKQNVQAQLASSFDMSASNDSISEIDSEFEIMANAAYMRTYNKENAWKYAYTYATSSGSSTPSTYYNSSVFSDFTSSGGDCMNFASQAIYAGFSGSNNSTHVNNGEVPQDKVGLDASNTDAAKTKWYAKPASTYWAWTSCSFFRNYVTYSTGDSNTRLYAIQKSISATSDFSEVGTSNLIGSIIHVNGASSLGHAIIVNNAVGTDRNQIYYTAHSANAKNCILADKYSGEMVSIRPVYFYDVTACTGTYTSHSFSGNNAQCTRCGYVRTYITPTLLAPVQKNTQVTLTAKTNHTVSSISMSVKDPNGNTTNFTAEPNTTSISRTYTPTVASHPNDLYTVTVTATSIDGISTTSTWTFRAF